jgi:hypothetical protein
MADVSVDIKEAVRQVYLADVEAIRNLSEVASKLQKDGLTIPGDLIVKGQIKGEKTISAGGEISNNSYSLSGLNGKIDSVNSSLSSSITNNNSSLTNQISSINNQLSNKINNNSNISLEDNLNPSYLLSTAEKGTTVVTSNLPNIQLPFGPNIIYNRKWKINNV